MSNIRVLLLILFVIPLLAFDSKTASMIFDKIFHAMIHKESIHVYTQNNIYKKVIDNALNLHLENDFNYADIILVDNISELPQTDKKLLIFTTSYPVFQKHKDAVGAFYWEYGHVKIEFSKTRLHKHNIQLPKSFYKYIKDTK